MVVEALRTAIRRTVRFAGRLHPNESVKGTDTKRGHICGRSLTQAGVVDVAPVLAVGASIVDAVPRGVRDVAEGSEALLLELGIEQVDEVSLIGGKVVLRLQVAHIGGALS